MKPTLTEKWIVCRVCLKQPKELMHTIFDKNDEKDLTQMLLECGGVPIKRFDHYPDKICSKCLKYLRVAYKFRITCQRSHKHLSRFIAPVVVEKVDVDCVVPDLTLELDETETIAVKLEPDEVKHEFSDNEDGEVVDIYEPMDEGDEGDIDAEAIEEIESIIHSSSSVNGEVEYLEIGEELSTSDEEFIPNAKAAKRNTRNSLPKQNSKSPIQKPSTSRRGTGKRGPKPKKIKKTTFICDICGNMYLSQGRLTEHIKLHKGIKPHVCEICGHAFAQMQQLDRHMNTHTGNRPYKCSYCPAAFADLSTRNKHHRIHTNERPYVCDVCGRAFTYTNTLKFHRMIHTGEKPHVCDICGKGFQQAYKLRNHKLTHEKKGIKLEKIQVDTIPNYQEVGVPSQDLEI